MNLNLLEGKTAIVTGGTRGIGFAIVKTYLENGAKVALCGSRQETVDKALAKLREENPDYPVMGITPDLSDFDSITAEFNKVKEAFGSIDILGNNAGVSARESIYEYDPEAFKKTMELNVNAAFLCCRSDHEGTRGRGHYKYFFYGKYLWSAFWMRVSYVKICNQWSH